MQAEIFLAAKKHTKGGPGPAGYAAVVRAGENVVELAGYDMESTPNEMLLMALRDGLQAVRQRYGAASSVTVVTDSAYVKRVLTDWMPTWKRADWKTSMGLPVKHAEIIRQIDRDLNASDFDVDFVRERSKTPRPDYYSSHLERSAALAAQQARVAVQQADIQATGATSRPVAPRPGFGMGM